MHGIKLHPILQLMHFKCLCTHRVFFKHWFSTYKSKLLLLPKQAILVQLDIEIFIWIATTTTGHSLQKMKAKWLIIHKWRGDKSVKIVRGQNKRREQTGWERRGRKRTRIFSCVGSLIHCFFGFFDCLWSSSGTYDTTWPLCVGVILRSD